MHIIFLKYRSIYDIHISACFNKFSDKNNILENGFHKDYLN